MKNSCSTLPGGGLPFLLSHPFFDRFHYALRGAQAKKDPPDVLRCHVQLARKLREIWSKLLRFTNLSDCRAKMNVQIESPEQAKRYSKANQLVKEIIPNVVNAVSRPTIGQAVFSLRKTLNYTQRQLAELVGVSQAQVAKWETDKLTPPGQVFARLSEFAGGEKNWWLQKAGVRVAATDREERSRMVPILRDPAAAGSPRVVDEHEVADFLTLPRGWLPVGGTLHAMTVTGDSMEPLLRTGFIVIVDVDQRNVQKLVGRMVVARVGDGVTVKWLRMSGPTLMLVPENLNEKNQLQIIVPGTDIGIVGVVVKWIGEPAAIKKRK